MTAKAREALKAMMNALSSHKELSMEDEDNYSIIRAALTGVRIPDTEQEAELMQKLGYNWLLENAPHRLLKNHKQATKS